MRPSYWVGEEGLSLETLNRLLDLILDEIENYAHDSIRKQIRLILLPHWKHDSRFLTNLHDGGLSIVTIPLQTFSRRGYPHQRSAQLSRLLPHDPSITGRCRSFLINPPFDHGNALSKLSDAGRRNGSEKPVVPSNALNEDGSNQHCNPYASD